jgi:DNA-3-methyladenine glycosylase
VSSFDPARSLPTDFYDRPVETVARELLGAWLVSRSGEELVAGIIVETEAYGGEDDLASHAAFRRNGVVRWMYGPPGTLYVYKAYGMYPCLNVVTGPEGTPSAVLVRAISLVHPSTDQQSASGPGRLGRLIGLDLSHNGHPLDRPPIWVQPGDDQPGELVAARRVGVNRGDHRHWRFAWRGHPAVSRPRPRLRYAPSP